MCPQGLRQDDARGREPGARPPSSSSASTASPSSTSASRSRRSPRSAPPCPDHDLSPIAEAMDRAGQTWASTSWAASARSCTRAHRAADRKLMDSIPHALAATERVCSSRQRGLHARRHQHGRRAQDAAQSSSECASRTADRDCIGAGKLVVFCNAVEDNPFMAGAVPRLRRGGRRHQRGRLRPRRRGRRRAAELPQDAEPHGRRRGHQGDRVQDHPRRRAHGREASGAWAWRRASWTCRWRRRRPRATPWPRSWRAIGVGECGGPGTTAALATAQRRREEGRRHGVAPPWAASPARSSPCPRTPA